MGMYSDIAILQTNRPEKYQNLIGPLSHEDLGIINTNVTNTVENAKLDFEDDQAKICKLALLPDLEYQQRRETEAKTIGIRVSALDKLVSDERYNLSDIKPSDSFETVEAWPEPVNAADPLADITATILRFCILPAHSEILMAAWVLHAWTHDAADISPILAFVSPEKRCGKTTALSVIGVLAPKAMLNVNVTTSVMFRVIEMCCPTVLIDEGDTYLSGNEELRGIINGGHNRFSAYVWRSVGDNHEPKQFKVWAPKCIAMIGKLPDTLEDRAIVVPLRRKQVGEAVERFRADKLAEFLPLRRRAKRWADDNIIKLQGMDPDVPNQLNDRAQDNARAICAIADLAGEEWPEKIRGALIGLAAQNVDESQSDGVLLLRNIAEILKTRQGDRIGSTDLCGLLCEMEDAPWAEWLRGFPITTRGIATLLKPYGIRSARDRSARFYRLCDFTDALTRYVVEPPILSDTSVTSDTVAARDTEKTNNIKDVTHDDTCDAYPWEDKEQMSSAGNEGEL